ncbi:MAG TPA: hypothetical protein VKG02_01330, partial [Blastocatellia bacterium]|nr:hypothetical protein [Blastocatellia bacterium]
FSSFQDAVAKADLSLKTLADDANKVPASLNKIGSSLSGTKLIQDATLMASAVEKIGGVSKLTANELQSLGSQAAEASAKMRALGLEVPANLQAIADAAKNAQQALGDAAATASQSSGIFGSLSASFSTFVAGVASGEIIAEIFKKIASSILEVGVAAAEALPQLIEHTIEVENSLYEMSLKTGASVENLSKLRYVASQTGIDFNSFATTLFKMEQNFDATGKKGEDLSKRLAQIGLNLNDLKNARPDEAFIKTMTAMEQMKNRADQASLGVALFGRGFRDMAGLTQESITELMAQAEKLGLVVSTQDAAAAHAAEVGWKQFQMQVEAAGMSIANVFIPAVTNVLNLMSEGFVNAMQKAGISTKDLQAIVAQVIR